MKKSWRCRSLMVLVAVVAVSLLPVRRAEAAEWDWSVAPYLWGAGIKMDVSVDNDPIFMADASFPDILDNTDLAAMIHFEGRKGKWGFLVDTLYLDVSDESTLPPRSILPGGAEADTEITTFIGEMAGFWRPGGKNRGMDFLFGVRTTAMETRVDITAPGPMGLQAQKETDDTFVDGFVGLRYSHPIGGRWDWALRGDIGAGGTNLTWNAVGTVGVRFDDKGKYSLRFGYRHMEMEFDSDDNGFDIENDVTFSGGIVGFLFGW